VFVYFAGQPYETTYIGPPTADQSCPTV